MKQERAFLRYELFAIQRGNMEEVCWGNRSVARRGDADSMENKESSGAAEIADVYPDEEAEEYEDWTSIWSRSLFNEIDGPEEAGEQEKPSAREQAKYNLYTAAQVMSGREAEREPARDTGGRRKKRSGKELARQADKSKPAKPGPASSPKQGAGTGTIHAGHRERMRKKFLRAGLDAFEDHELLEFLLYYAFSRGDTNELAHRLLNHFRGDLCSVFEADAEKLMEVKGIGETSAALIRLVAALHTRYLKARRPEGIRLRTSMETGQFLLREFAYKNREEVMVLCLDGDCRLLSCDVVGAGNICSVAFSPRDIVRLALEKDAIQVVLAHNHVSGVAVPSNADVQSTRAILYALESVNVYLRDHIVVSVNEGEFVSMRESGYFDALERK